MDAHSLTFCDSSYSLVVMNLGGAGGQTVHNRSTFGAPLKTYGHNTSNELCGRLLSPDDKSKSYQLKIKDFLQMVLLHKNGRILAFKPTYIEHFKNENSKFAQ